MRKTSQREAIEGVSDNYEWYVKTDTSTYAGKWIAIMNQEVIASGEDADKVYREAEKECPGGKFSIAKVPCDEILVRLLFVSLWLRVRVVFDDLDIERRTKGIRGIWTFVGFVLKHF